VTELSTKDIATHFGLPLTAGFVVDTLGVPIARQEKRAMYWNADQVPVIGEKLAEYVRSRGAAPVDGKAEDDDLFG